MTNKNPLADPQDPDEDIDEIFAWGHPNPGRVGCPPREVLIALARGGERSNRDEGYDHVANCSPCYREFLAEVEGNKGATRVDRWRPFSRSGWLATAAALVLAAIVGTWWLLQMPGDEPAGEVRREEPRARMTDVRLDLRPYAVMRGVENAGSPEPLSLTRGRLRLTMLLPVGFRPGEYEVQVFDADMQSKARATGQAVIQDELATLQVGINLESVEPGRYRLGLRRNGQAWRLFPVQVR